VSKEHLDKAAVVAKLNQILEMELAGVVRYTHYSLMVFGYGRIPIVSWLRNEANEAMMHAQKAGRCSPSSVLSGRYRDKIPGLAQLPIRRPA
jgi:Ferritin-like domain